MAAIQELPMQSIVRFEPNGNGTTGPPVFACGPAISQGHIFPVACKSSLIYKSHAIARICRISCVLHLTRVPQEQEQENLAQTLQ